MSGEEQRTRIPGIFKRRGTYTFRYYDRQGKVRRSSAPTLAAAKRKRAELNTDVARGDHNPSTSQTFSNYADRWIETYAGRTRRGFREETRDDYKRILEADAKPFLGKMRIGDVRAQDIKAYAQHVSTREVRRGGIDQRVKPNTVRLSLAPVRAMFATALEEGIIRVNPCVGVRIATATTTAVEGENDEEARALSDEELTRVLAAVPENWRLLPDFLSETALRIGEALALEWGDVDLGTRRIHVRRRYYRGKIGPPKSRYGRRSVPLTPRMAQELWKRQKAASDVGDRILVFPSKTGGYLDTTNLYRWWNKAAEEVGVGWAGFHTLRHTCATRLFRMGWNAKQVQLMLGHHSPAFTLATYVHVMADELPGADVRYGHEQTRCRCRGTASAGGEGRVNS